MSTRCPFCIYFGITFGVTVGFVMHAEDLQSYHWYCSYLIYHLYKNLVHDIFSVPNHCCFTWNLELTRKTMFTFNFLKNCLQMVQCGLKPWRHQTSYIVERLSYTCSFFFSFYWTISSHIIIVIIITMPPSSFKPFPIKMGLAAYGGRVKFEKQHPILTSNFPRYI